MSFKDLDLLLSSPAWLDTPVSELDEEQLESLRFYVARKKTDEYMERLRNRETDAEEGPRESYYQSDHYKDVPDAKKRAEKKARFRSQLGEMGERELEEERQELVESIRTGGNLSRRRFILGAATASAGAIFGIYKLCKVYQEEILEYGGVVADLFVPESEEGRLTFLDREFDSAADYAEFIADINYYDLSSEEQSLAMGLSSLWTPKGYENLQEMSNNEQLTREKVIDEFFPELDQQSRQLADELIRTVRHPRQETPFSVLRESDRYLLDYNAAKMMVYELVNDIHQQGNDDAWQEAESWLIDGLRGKIDYEDLEYEAGIVDSYELVQRYLEENYGGRPGLRLLGDVFDSIDAT